MRIIRFLSVLLLAMTGVVGLAGPAQAASGPWRQVSGGGNHTCAINATDSLYCWGRNVYGQTGTGTDETPQFSLFRVGAANVWASVEAGEDHTCGITKAKNLYCWGHNMFGQTGDGTPANHPRLSLHRVGAAGVWASVSGGAYHTCGITTAKNLYCWGQDAFGESGDGSAGPARLTLYRVAAAGVWASVTAGEDHTCGITTAKNLYCWGYNGYGQVGDGTTENQRLTPVRVGGAGVWASATAGFVHTCGITTAKNLYCWGGNEDAQVGDGTTVHPHQAMARVGGAGVWAGATGGAYHTCGITTAKNLYCWGYNGFGQVGDGDIETPRKTLFRVL